MALYQTKISSEYIIMKPSVMAVRMMLSVMVESIAIIWMKIIAIVIKTTKLIMMLMMMMMVTRSRKRKRRRKKKKENGDDDKGSDSDIGYCPGDLCLGFLMDNRSVGHLFQLAEGLCWPLSGDQNPTGYIRPFSLRQDWQVVCGLQRLADQHRKKEKEKIKNHGSSFYDD